MAKTIIKSGTVLLAEPFMLDPNFKRSAVLLCEHNEEGSIGLIFNRPLDLQINELIHGFPEFRAPVFFGGPVQTDTLHYIHNAGDLLEGSRKVSDGVWWGGDFEKLKFFISNQLITPAELRFFVGYAGWGEGQLSDELSTGSWILADMDPNYIFKSKPDQIWSQIMANKGGTFTVIATMPDGPDWN